MRTLLLAACFLPLTAAQADHRSLEDACALAAGMIIDKQHTNSIRSVDLGKRPTVNLDVHLVPNGTSLPVRCSFGSETAPYGLVRICVMSTCYSHSADYETRRKLFRSIKMEVEASDH